MNSSQNLANTIIAILDLARQKGHDKILLTSLVKYIYLIDVFTAEENNGVQTWTNLEWKFYNYGPYTTTITDEIHALVNRHSVEEVLNDEKKYKLYKLPDHAMHIKDLLSLGVSRYVKLQLSGVIQRYSDNLALLLDYVYFRTTPMLNANIGEILSFKDCRMLNISEFKPLQMKKLNPKKLAENKRKLQELIKNKQSTQRTIFTGVYDDVYFNGMKSLEGEHLEVGLSGQAIINIKE